MRIQVQNAYFEGSSDEEDQNADDNDDILYTTSKEKVKDRN